MSGPDRTATGGPGQLGCGPSGIFVFLQSLDEVGVLFGKIKNKFKN